MKKLEEMLVFFNHQKYEGEKIRVFAVYMDSEEISADLSSKTDQYIELFSAVRELNVVMRATAKISTPANYFGSHIPLFCGDISAGFEKVGQAEEEFGEALEASDSTWNHDFFIFVTVFKA